MLKEEKKIQIDRNINIVNRSKNLSHRRTAKEFGLPYRADVSFGQALKLHTAMLKSLGRPAPTA